jgi:hypothetical protein
VKNRFQNVPFKFNLHRYVAGEGARARVDGKLVEIGGRESIA